MKNLFLGIALVLFVGVLAVNFIPNQGQPLGGGGSGVLPFYYTSATISTSSVATTWSTSPVLSADSSRGYVSFCNESTAAGQAIYLGMGATSTGISGIKIAANSCYEMTQDKMFYGNIYAIGSTSANTLLKVVGSY